MGSESNFDKDKKVNKLCMSEHFWVTGTLAGIGLFLAFYGPFSAKYGLLAIAILFLAGAVIAFRRGFGLYTSMVTPIEQSPEYIHYTRGVHYALEQELEKRVKNKIRLEDEQRETTKFFFIGIVLAASGIWLVRWKISYLSLSLAVVFDGITKLSYVFILIGVACIVAGIRIFWYWFVNSNFNVALKLSDFLTLDTYPMKIRKEIILIGAIGQRLENDKKKERMERKREEGPIIGLDKERNII